MAEPHPRPSCVLQVWDLPGEPRPRWTPIPGVKSEVREISNVVGLTRMGVNLRTVPSGAAGTVRHFHTVEEEWVYVLHGRGTVRIGPLRLPFRAGSFVGFPPGPRPHHFLSDAGEDLVLLEGGERRPAEDTGCYVDIPKWWRNGQFLDIADAPPPEEGEASQVVHVDDIPDQHFDHDVDARAHRQMRRLNRPTGLERQAVVWSLVQPGELSTAFHTHLHSDEWIYILAGRARVRIGDETFEVGPDDFIGHAAGGAAHVMQPLEPLTYLMGGEINPADVVLYPEAGLRRFAGKLEALA